MTKKNTAAQPAQQSMLDTPAAPTTQEVPPEVKTAPAAQQTIADSHGVVARATALQVTNPEQYVAAGELVQTLRGTNKRLEEERKSLTDPIRLSLNRVMDFFRPHVEAVEKAGNIVKQKLADYDREQERIAAEARRKAEAEAARQRAEAERKAREEREAAERKAAAERAEAERQRREQEEAARREREAREAAERAAREAEEARRRGDEEAARKAAAQAAEQQAAARREKEQAEAAARAAASADAKADRTEAKGQERAAAHEEAAATIVAPIIETERPKVGGIARRKTWKYRLKDASKLKREFLIPDEQKLAKLAKAMGKDAEAMVGEGAIECYEEYDIAARAK